MGEKTRTPGEWSEEDKLFLVEGGGLEVLAPEPGVLEGLKRKPVVDKDGQITGYSAPLSVGATGHQNAIRILRDDTRWNGGEVPRLVFNEFRQVVELDGADLADRDEFKLHLWLHDAYSLSLPVNRIKDVVVHVAHEFTRHPLRDTLEGLTWDGVPRVHGLLARYLGADDTELHAAISKRWAISAVARVFRPGCKVDTTLLLSGGQGVGKSTAFRLLALEDRWFSDSLLDLRGTNKDAYQALSGIWLYELSELDSIRRAALETVKAFLSSQVDQFRPPYGRHMVTRPRANLFVASTNSAEPLMDATGSRRFWPVEVGEIDLEAIETERDQFWAEAVTMLRAGEPWWLNRIEAACLVEASERFQQSDPWEVVIRQWLPTQVGEFTTYAALVASDLEMRPGDIKRGDAMRMASILQALGCSKTRRVKVDGTRSQAWTKFQG